MQRIVFYHPKTFASALLPTNLIYWIVGMGVIEYPVGNPRRIFGFIYTSIVCIIYITATSIHYDLISLEGEVMGSSLGNFGFRISNWLNFILTFGIIVVSVACCKKRNDCLMLLAEIDAATKKMDVACSYQTILIRQVWQLFGPILFLLSTVAISYVFLSQYNHLMGTLRVTSMWYYYTYPMCLSAVADMTFCTIIRVMTQYFKDLNSLLQAMRINFPDDICNTRMGNLIQVDAIIADKEKLERLRCIRTIYSRLVCVANLWTELNGLQIVSSVVISVCMSTILAQQIYSTLFEFGNPLYHSPGLTIQNLHTMLFYIGKLCLIVGTTAALTSEVYNIMMYITLEFQSQAKRTCAILLEHLHPIAYIRSEVHEFSLQLIQNPLRLSAGGLFDLDYSLLQMVMTTVSTYLVILIQTGSSENGSNPRYHFS